MAGTLKRLAGPAYLANAAANIFTPAASTIYTVIRHIHIVNDSASAATFSLWLGATGGSAGGTELYLAQSLGANSSFDAFWNLKTLSTDFLTGLASLATTLTITVSGEQYVV